MSSELSRILYSIGGVSALDVDGMVERECSKCHQLHFDFPEMRNVCWRCEKIQAEIDRDLDLEIEENEN